MKRQPVMNAINRCMFRSCVHVPTRDVPPDLIREIVNEHVLLLMAARNGFVLMMRSKNGLLLLIMAARAHLDRNVVSRKSLLLRHATEIQQIAGPHNLQKTTRARCVSR